MRIDFPAVRSAKSTINNLDELASFKSLYDYLLNSTDSQLLKQLSSNFLAKQLREIPFLNEPLPTDEAGLLYWLVDHAEKVGRQYQAYLTARHNREPRKYFINKAHALFFIKNVAPTKLVDGAWLYGFTRHHQTERFSGLINTYLEELGDGVQEKNHVSLYKKLLKTYGLDPADELDDTYYQQGAIQLTLGHLTDDFLPEAVGFNLGYEQLPLHLLITAYELKELGIDPYYFTLHVTIDNAYSGHAKEAVRSVLGNTPLLGNKEDYFLRVSRGFQLNNLGVGTEAIIAAFDLEQEFISIIRQKANIGKYMHAGHCLIEGRSINDWLSASGEIPQFIAALESSGWIRRHTDPTQSRFWKLIENNKAMMFGVFSPYEKQVVYDWIAGDFIKETSHYFKRVAALSQNQAKDFPPNNATVMQIKSAPDVATNIIPLHGHQSSSDEQIQAHNRSAHTWDEDIVLFDQKIKFCQTQEQLMQLLTAWMTPSRHHSVVGLKATRLFKEQLHSRKVSFK